MAEFSKLWAEEGIDVEFITADLRDLPLPKDYKSVSQARGNLKFTWIPTLENWLSHSGFGRAIALRGFTWRVLNKLVFPDACVWWARQAFKYAKENGIIEGSDIVFTSSTPYSTHLVGVMLKKYSNGGPRWVADFRDPWTTNYQYSSKRFFPFERIRDRHLENKIYNLADLIIANTNINKEEIEDEFGVSGDKISVVQNGFSLLSLDGVAPKIKPIEGRFRLGYIGGLRGDWYEGEFYNVLDLLRKNDPKKYENLDVIFAGSDEIPSNLIDDLSLREKIINLGHVERDELPPIIKSCDAFLLLLPAYASDKPLGWVPQKLYLYMAAKKPVFAIIPEGEAAAYINDLGIGKTIAPGDVEAISASLCKFIDWRMSPNSFESEFVEFSKPHLAKKLLAKMQELG